MNDLKLFSGRANPDLAQKMCDYLRLTPGKITIKSFPDGELWCKIEEDVRGRDVFLLQPTSPPVNENLMELLIMIDSFKRASAERVTAVVPYFGYARQDRKDAGRVPITAKLAANLITRAGADRVLAMDLHAACASFIFGLITGMQFVATGCNQLVLVIGADCNSRVVDPTDEHTYPLFGDAAGAVLLSPGGKDQGLLSYAVVLRDFHGVIAGFR